MGRGGDNVQPSITFFLLTAGDRMHVEVGVEEGHLRFDVTGKLDSVSALEFEETVMGGMRDNPKDTLFHLQDLNYISSSGLRVFLQAAKAARMHNNRVVLSALQPQVKEIFDLAGFTQIFTLADSLENALSLLHEQA